MKVRTDYLCVNCETMETNICDVELSEVDQQREDQEQDEGDSGKNGSFDSNQWSNRMRTSAVILRKGDLNRGVNITNSPTPCVI